MRQGLVKRLNQKVIAAYMTTQDWTEQEVIGQVLTPLEEASVFGTAVADDTSITCYQIGLTADRRKSARMLGFG